MSVHRFRSGQTGTDTDVSTAHDDEWLAERFEESRAHLRAVAYRMLGSLSEADDAIPGDVAATQPLRSAECGQPDGWLTTIVSRVCLDMLRSRRSRREESLDRLPEPIVSRDGAIDPEHEVLLADSIGLALLVVARHPAPAERLAFVLHDMFGVPFDEIAPIVGRSATAARQLASRARRRVRAEEAVPDVDAARQREVVDAFLAAARDGDLDALVAVLDPDVQIRAERAGRLTELRGARAVAEQALAYSRRSPDSPGRCW